MQAYYTSLHMPSFNLSPRTLLISFSSSFFCLSFSRFQLKDRVVVNYNNLNKWWCPGVIIEIDDTPAIALYDVKFDDGDALNTIPETHLRRERGSFPVAVIKTNSKVVAKHIDGIWYAGTVTIANTGAAEFSDTISCDVSYDDSGHVVRNLPLESIRLICYAKQEPAVFMIGTAVLVGSDEGVAAMVVKGLSQSPNYCTVQIVGDSRVKSVSWTMIRQSKAFFDEKRKRDKYRYAH